MTPNDNSRGEKDSNDYSRGERDSKSNRGEIDS